MLKGDILCKRGKQNTLLRKDIMPKSVVFFFFCRNCGFFLRKGRFFLMFFLLKPAGRTVVGCFGKIKLKTLLLLTGLCEAT